MTDAQEIAERTVARMLEHDAFSRWMKVELVHLEPDHCTLRMTVRDEMCNGFHICHGGITYSLADSAFAFASNSSGRLAMSVENNIVYPAKVVSGDVLTAAAVPRSVGHKLATYDVTVSKQDKTVVGIFRGTVYRTSRPVVPEGD
ncbi:MAG: hotdog fold thioesterase [Acidobacteriota bacterium]|nr:hotdog fold thioesterase [Acidobacteriota bacterium]